MRPRIAVMTLIDNKSRAQLFHIDLIGAPILVTARERSIERTFTANTARYSRTKHTLTVFGPGEAKQIDRSTKASARESFDTLSASWQETMIYDELAGIVELQGDAILAAQNSGKERHTAKGHLVTLRLSPSESGPSRFLSASIDALDDAHPATLEMKRFAPGNAETMLGLANIRGPRIEMDAVENSLEVIGKGLLIVDDRSTKDDTNNTGDGDIFAFGANGSTLFEWNNKLRFDRPMGLATMEGRVRVLHRGAGASETTQLECEIGRAHV